MVGTQIGRTGVNAQIHVVLETSQGQGLVPIRHLNMGAMIVWESLPKR